MSFLDYILAGFGVYEIKDETKKQNSKRFLSPKKPLANFVSTKEIQKSPTFETCSSKMALFCPKTTNEVTKIAKFLASNQPVLVDVSNLDDNLLVRCLDFLVGAKTALDAKMKHLENGLFVFVPKGTQLVGFLGEEND